MNNYKKLKKFTVEKRSFGLCNYWHSTVIISRVNLIDLPSYLEVCVCVCVCVCVFMYITILQPNPGMWGPVHCRRGTVRIWAHWLALLVL